MGAVPEEERVPCPACGGAGGGPFGRMGSAWDDEDYVCPRCEGTGEVRLSDLVTKPATSPVRPGIVKTTTETALPEKKKKPA